MARVMDSVIRCGAAASIGSSPPILWNQETLFVLVLGRFFFRLPNFM